MARNFWLGAFDPSKDYVARGRLTLAGREFQPNETIDKTLVPTRRLKLLYDHRVILLAPGQSNAAPGDTRHQSRGRRISSAMTVNHADGAAVLPPGWPVRPPEPAKDEPEPATERENASPRYPGSPRGKKTRQRPAKARGKGGRARAAL